MLTRSKNHGTPSQEDTTPSLGVSSPDDFQPALGVPSPDDPTMEASFLGDSAPSLGEPPRDDLVPSGSTGLSLGGLASSQVTTPVFADISAGLFPTEADLYSGDNNLNQNAVTTAADEQSSASDIRLDDESGSPDAGLSVRVLIGNCIRENAERGRPSTTYPDIRDYVKRVYPTMADVCIQGKILRIVRQHVLIADYVGKLDWNERKFRIVGDPPMED